MANCFKTKGYLGLEQSGYAVDTLTLPDSNPWNSWLRTTALDFFSDGGWLSQRMGETFGSLMELMKV